MKNISNKSNYSHFFLSLFISSRRAWAPKKRQTAYWTWLHRSPQSHSNTASWGFALFYSLSLATIIPLFFMIFISISYLHEKCAILYFWKPTGGQSTWNLHINIRWRQAIWDTSRRLSWTISRRCCSSYLRRLWASPLAASACSLPWISACRCWCIACEIRQRTAFR